MKPSSQLVMLNGLRFHFLDWGNDTAQPLVLLHGFTSHAHSWDTFAAAMSDQFHVLALDQRGHGQSDWADDYSAERMAEDVNAFVHALGLHKIALLGLSMGGWTAYTYAALHGSSVERLVIVDMGPDIAPNTVSRVNRNAASNDVFETAEEAYQFHRSLNMRPPEAEHRHRITHNLMRLQDGRWTWRYDKKLRDSSRPLVRPKPEDAWRWLGSIQCPTLLVRGVDSETLEPETAEKMMQVMPNCKLVTVAESGHPVPLDNPDGFIAAVKPFLLS